MINKYVKKPIAISAFQWNGDNIESLEDLGCEKDLHYYFSSGNLRIRTPEGDHTVKVGCYIIRGIKGEFYPCDPEIFNATYDQIKK